MIYLNSTSLLSLLEPAAEVTQVDLMQLPHTLVSDPHIEHVNMRMLVGSYLHHCSQCFSPTHTHTHTWQRELRQEQLLSSASEPKRKKQTNTSLLWMLMGLNVGERKESLPLGFLMSAAVLFFPLLALRVFF